MSQKKISIYKSFEEQKLAEINYLRSITPTERLRQVVQLIRQVYKVQLQNYVPNKRITILRK